MELLKAVDQCCGCAACAAVCPRSAIAMTADGEGFLYPKIDPARCVDCGRCETVCAIQRIHAGEEAFRQPVRKAWAVKHRDESIRMVSRSGGAFTAVSDAVLAAGGAVYGAILAGDMTVRHVRAVCADDRDRMRGSKYVQSLTEPSLYADVKADVQSGRSVLYTGTSCQVAAVRAFLGKLADAPNLLTMDIVCHGVPSAKVFRDYLAYQQERLGAAVEQVNFRNKAAFGWAAHVETVTAGDKPRHDGLFTLLYYGDCIMRPSCYACPYKGLAYPGDLTSADYWGVDAVLHGFNDNRGVSLVLCNTEKGADALAQADNIDVVEVDVNASQRSPLRAPVMRPANRDAFWADYHARGFSFVAEKYAGKRRAWVMRYRIKKLLTDLQIYRPKK